MLELGSGREAIPTWERDASEVGTQAGGVGCDGVDAGKEGVQGVCKKGLGCARAQVCTKGRAPAKAERALSHLRDFGGSETGCCGTAVTHSATCFPPSSQWNTMQSPHVHPHPARGGSASRREPASATQPSASQS